MNYERQREKWILPASWLKIWNNPQYWRSLPVVKQRPNIYYRVEGKQ